MRHDRLRFCAGAAVLVLLMIFTLNTINAKAESKLQISAKAAIVYNGSTGEVLFEKNADEPLPMASTTKIMSALIVLEQEDLDERFTVDSEAVNTEGSSMGLREGDEVSLRDLACGMLLPSGNDAANAAAVRVAGSIDSFVGMMNARAVKMGLENTHFVTPSGLDDYTDDHYSTARDMAVLAAEAMENQDFRDICGLQRVKLEFGCPPYERWLINTNKLLKNHGITGIKTGFTDKARRCLVSACQRDGCTLICVTLNAPDDWNDHMKLYNYSFGRVSKKQLKLRDNEIMLNVVGCAKDSIPCTIPEGSAFLTEGALKKVKAEIHLPGFVYSPVKEGEAVGEVVYTLDGKEIARGNITANTSIS